MSDFVNEAILDCNYLFHKKAPSKRWKAPVQCYKCKYAEHQDNLPPKYIHCTYYPNMISHEDKTCKAGELK